MSGKREFGDYQTPQDFSLRVCEYLKNTKHISPTAIVEPTCGVGNFLKSSLIFDANEIYGIEINPEYCALCEAEISDKRVKVINKDFFGCSLKSLIRNDSQVLIVGNPPWVTNSELSQLGSSNLPVKNNFKELKGLDAITGGGNFDICEYMILQIINEYRDTNAVISMLCKTSVARNIFKEAKRSGVNFASFEVYEFDASKVFGISASACMLYIELSSGNISSDICSVFDFDSPSCAKSQFGYINGNFYSDISSDSSDYDGECCFEWRQGVKHDCSKVMELSKSNTTFYNGRNEPLDIEDEIVFPLVKSSMFKKPIIKEFSKYVIVTQKKVKEDTTHLSVDAPKTWKYLNDNIDLFRGRKSSIYKDAPDFSMFGVGDYSYSKYKVGVSGFYKKPLFSLLFTEDGKPVMTDDTAYFICFDDYYVAYVVMLILNSEKVQSFLSKIAFLDSKRPYTKKVLQRIDFSKIVEDISFEDLTQTEKQLGLDSTITKIMFDSVISTLGKRQISLF